VSLFFFARTFNPADYPEPAQAEEGYGGDNNWNSTGTAEPDDGAASKSPGRSDPGFDSRLWSLGYMSFSLFFNPIPPVSPLSTKSPKKYIQEYQKGFNK